MFDLDVKRGGKSPPAAIDPAWPAKFRAFRGLHACPLEDEGANQMIGGRQAKNTPVDGDGDKRLGIAILTSGAISMSEHDRTAATSPAGSWARVGAHHHCPNDLRDAPVWDIHRPRYCAAQPNKPIKVVCSITRIAAFLGRSWTAGHIG